MKFNRSAGILLHPTSLPGKYGIGDLGKSAFEFVDFLKKARQSHWQIFPLGPTGYGDSPYQCFSAFAGNPLLVSPELLSEDGLLTPEDLKIRHQYDPQKIDFGSVIDYKNELFRKAYKTFLEKGYDIEETCGNFCEDNKAWLDDYALFMACKKEHNGSVWSNWEKDIAFREAGATEKWKTKLQVEVNYHKFIQFLFFKQWKAVKQYANDSGITIIGDLPIFIAYDSADLWANKKFYTVDSEGVLESVAGVPPDYFSATGQLWGNPLYKWDEMKKDGFNWWINRFRKMYQLVDIVRIDHFRGFEAYYEIPGGAETAEKGEWIKAPGDKLFLTLREELGDVPILAEDLGIITKEVEELRDKFEFPGMKILQFAFGKTGDRKFLPHNHIKNCVVYTGSHDNETTRGFFEREKESDSGIFQWAQKYLNYYGDDLCFEIIRTAYASVADIVIVPLQDILNLGNEARMNFPGKPAGNWTWRYENEQLTEDLAQLYHEMTEYYDRPEVESESDEITIQE